MSATAQAAMILRSGGLVAFPTETVYGLGADATNPAAVRKIFAAKGRPATNPLIVHVADAEIAKRYTKEWPGEANKLAEAFWPGPLTIVVAKQSSIADEATAGGGTVGLRVPNHPVALELLRAFGGPVAAPSANRSNHVSPTTAGHVREELGGAVDLILDGGPCAVGIESTVLDLSGGEPTILRPGGVSREQIEAILRCPVRLLHNVAKPDEPQASPGQLAVHYSPRTPAYRFDTDTRESIERQTGVGRRGVMALGPSSKLGRKGWVVDMPNEPVEYARHLYAVLRELDGLGLDVIFVELPPSDPAWAAVRDRLLRATRPLEELKGR